MWLWRSPLDSLHPADESLAVCCSFTNVFITEACGSWSGSLHCSSQCHCMLLSEYKGCGKSTWTDEGRSLRGSFSSKRDFEMLRAEGGGE